MVAPLIQGPAVLATLGAQRVEPRRRVLRYDETPEPIRRNTRECDLTAMQEGSDRIRAWKRLDYGDEEVEVWERRGGEWVRVSCVRDENRSR